jgi:subtilase-type serine protease
MSVGDAARRCVVASGVARAGGSAGGLRPALLTTALALIGAAPALAVDVATEAQLRNAIFAANTTTEAEARAAFELASGELHASVQQALAGSGNLFNETLRRRAGLAAGTELPSLAPSAFAIDGARPESSPWLMAAEPLAGAAATPRARINGVWAAGYGGRSRIDGDGGLGVGAADLRWREVGIAAGAERRLDGLFGIAEGFLVGIAGGYSQTDADVTARLSEADVTSAHLGIYTASTVGPVHIASATSVSFQDVETTRRIRFGAIDRVAEASYDARTITSSGEASLPFAFGNLTLAPLLAYHYARVKRDGFAETGAQALNLSVRDEEFAAGGASAGVAVSHFAAIGGAVVKSEVRVSYEHGLGDWRPASVASFAGGPAAFTVFGPEAGRDRLAVGAGLGVGLSDRFGLTARYDGRFSGSGDSHAAHLSGMLRF